jgi:hypothetical protein
MNFTKIGRPWLMVTATILAAACAPQDSPQPSTEPQATADDLPALADTTAASAVTDLARYAADCFAEQRRRNPVGRLLALSANIADICSAVAEIGEGRDRWHFDWRRAEQGWVHEGEVSWPEDWPPAEAGGIGPGELTAERIAGRLAAARARHAEAAHEDWLYEVLWLPAPFERALVYVTLADRSEGAGPYDSSVVIYDGERELEGEEYGWAQQRYALTRFELREDHNYKGAIFESRALMESAGMLEADAGAVELSPLERRLEDCLPTLRTVNWGSRVLRIAADAAGCRIVLASASDREDFYLLALAADGYEELPSLRLDPDLVTANLLVDRGRLSSARARQVLATAAERLGSPAERLAIVAVDGDTVWQASVGGGTALRTVWFDELGQQRPAPDRYPVSSFEVDAGFPPSPPILAPIVEAP